MSETSPRVSVITPSFNQGGSLRATIESVLAQTYSNIEYIVIDGGSTDGSVEIIRHHADHLAYWVSEPDRGQAHAINKGLAVAQGDIIGWLNSDDVYLPDTVETAVTVLADRSEVDVVYGRLTRIDVTGHPIPTPTLPKDRLTFDRHHVFGECIVNQPGSFWRRGIMDRVGRLNEDLQYVMDYEWWARMVAAGAQFQRLDRVMAKFRLSQDSKTVGQTAKMAREHLAVIDKLLADPGFVRSLDVSPADVTRQTKQGRAVVCMYAAYGCAKEGRWREAQHWWLQAQRNDPTITFQRRWRDLGWATLRRRWRLGPAATKLPSGS